MLRFCNLKIIVIEVTVLKGRSKTSLGNVPIFQVDQNLS